MEVTIVHVQVKPEYIADFIEATQHNHVASINEPGNVRFDVLQAGDDPSCFILYEAYRTQNDALRHKESEHYLAWRKAVAAWMAEPRQGVPYKGLFPKIDT